MDNYLSKLLISGYSISFMSARDDSIVKIVMRFKAYEKIEDIPMEFLKKMHKKDELLMTAIDKMKDYIDAKYENRRVGQ